MTTPRKLLLVGGPKTGKSHFLGQLNIRLTVRNGRYKLLTLAEDLSVVQEISERLHDGLSGEHTPTGFNQDLLLTLVDESGATVELVVPDYGGEQIQQLVTDRRINPIWQTQLEASGDWLLFVRLDALLPLEDLINRDLPDAAELEKRNQQAGSTTLTEQSFFVELLQILLYARGCSVFEPAQLPNLTVVLTCWDNLSTGSQGSRPDAVLAKELPMLHHFLTATWPVSAWQTWGLSSTGRTLNATKPDADYLHHGPEEFGYVIQPDGQSSNDLTLLLASLLDTP